MTWPADMERLARGDTAGAEAGPPGEPRRRSDLTYLVAGIVCASVQEKAEAFAALGLTVSAERNRHGTVTGRLILAGIDGGKPRRFRITIEDVSPDPA
jgi:hypothetical protein